MPAYALNPSQPHTALIWLIRGTGLVIAVISPVTLALGLYIVFAGSPTQGPLLFFGVMLAMLLFGAIFLVGYSMLLKIDETTLSYFIFVFSLLVAYSFYLFLPQDPPQMLSDIVGIDASAPARITELGIAYRVAFALVTFLIFYAMVEEFLLRFLGFTVRISSQRQKSRDLKAPVDPSVPSGPRKNSPGVLRKSSRSP